MANQVFTLFLSDRPWLMTPGSYRIWAYQEQNVIEPKIIFLTSDAKIKIKAVFSPRPFSKSGTTHLTGNVKAWHSRK